MVARTTHPVDAVLARLAEDRRVELVADLEAGRVRIRGLPAEEVAEIQRATTDLAESLRLTVLGRAWMGRDPGWRARARAWPEEVREVAQERARYFEHRLGLPPDVASWYGYTALAGWDRQAAAGKEKAS
jgi:hypothetical protein